MLHSIFSQRIFFNIRLGSEESQPEESSEASPATDQQALGGELSTVDISYTSVLSGNFNVSPEEV